MKKKDTRGGANRNQGRRQKYGEETEQLSFRCPKSRVKEMKAIINAQLKTWADEIQSQSKTKDHER